MNAAAVDSGCVAAVCVSLARKAQLHWLRANTPYSDAASLSCLTHMPADISISAFSCVLSFGSAAVKFCAQSARHQNANRRLVTERSVRLIRTMMVLSPPSASTAVTAPPSRLISSFCTGSTAYETPTIKRHCQVKHKRVRVVWFGCSNHKVFQTPGPIRHPTKTTG